MIIPDKVIEQAAKAASDALTPEMGPDVLIARAFADVIAAWAREQGRTEGAAEERERIKRLVAAESGQARKDYNSDPQAYYRGVEEGMENLLAALDREEDQ